MTRSSALAAATSRRCGPSLAEARFFDLVEALGQRGATRRRAQAARKRHRERCLCRALGDPGSRWTTIDLRRQKALISQGFLLLQGTSVDPCGGSLAEQVG